MAKSFLNVSQAFRNNNEAENEIEYLLQSVKMYERLYKNNHRNLDLANSYSLLGKLVNQNFYFCLKYSETFLNAGSAYGSTTTPQIELGLKKDSLEIKQNIFLGDHFEIAKTLTDISNAYRNSKDYLCQLKFAVYKKHFYQK